jgi:glutathione peroxidase
VGILRTSSLKVEECSANLHSQIFQETTMSLPTASIALLFTASGALLTTSSAAACHALMDYEATRLRSSEQVNFCQEFDGKALLVVNTASQCGYTPQFTGLEELHKQYGEKLAIVGFPSDDFNQEYADAEKIADVCRINYGVTFTMLEPSKVKGEGANTLFKKLAESTGEEPGWNFTKYVISADGNTVTHFPSSTKPSDAALIESIEKAIN